MKIKNDAMKYLVLLIVCIPLILSGCEARTSQVVGGTAGSLTAGEFPIPDFEIKVYKTGDTVPLGLGTTGKDGKFQLFQPKGEGPLWLEEGEYSITLESVGPEMPRMLPAYTNPSKTPVKVKWKGDDKSLELKIPSFK